MPSFHPLGVSTTTVSGIAQLDCRYPLGGLYRPGMLGNFDQQAVEILRREGKDEAHDTCGAWGSSTRPETARPTLEPAWCASSPTCMYGSADTRPSGTTAWVSTATNRCTRSLTRSLPRLLTGIAVRAKVSIGVASAQGYIRVSVALRSAELGDLSTSPTHRPHDRTGRNRTERSALAPSRGRWRLRRSTCRRSRLSPPAATRARAWRVAKCVLFGRGASGVRCGSRPDCGDEVVERVRCPHCGLGRWRRGVGTQCFATTKKGAPRGTLSRARQKSPRPT